MPFEHYIQSGGKRLRCGYTTGTCAALAAAGAARLLLGGRAPESVTLTTPGGLPVTAAPRYCRMAGETACCAVEKDGGDDIDATHGALIEARVERAAQPGVVIDGGPGVGRVTKAGLDQPVGAAAINRVPRRMIEQAVRAVCDALNWDGGLQVTICVPEGAALAKKLSTRSWASRAAFYSGNLRHRGAHEHAGAHRHGGAFAARQARAQGRPRAADARQLRCGFSA